MSGSILDFRARFEDPAELMRLAAESHRADMWTALPGIIQSYDTATMTAVVQVSIQLNQIAPDRSIKPVTIQPLPDVPVVFPRGGGYELTFPIASGDECLLVFSSRCIDNWWDKGGVQPQRELRMHDISDGFAIVGPWSQKTKISKLSTTTTQLRTDDGTMYVEVDKTNKRIRLVSAGLLIEVDDSKNQINIAGSDNITILANTQVTLSAPTVLVQGDLHVTGQIVGGSGGGDQVTLSSHQHGTGTPAAGTVAPTAGT
jgi:phage baseplate assembly protein gpV